MNDDVKLDIQEETLDSAEACALSDEGPSDEEIVDEAPPIDEDAVEAMSIEQKAALIEALIFAHGEPLGVEKISDVSKISVEDTTQALANIAGKYRGADSGFELVCVAEQYQFRTKSRFSPFVRALK